MKGCVCAIWVVGVLGCQLGGVRGSPAGRVAAVPCASGECERACEGGNLKACTQAAELYWDGAGGSPFDPERSMRFAARGCDGGDGLACSLRGRQHETGIGTEWAPALAVADYERACTAGAGLGCALLGAMYLRGHGVDPDREKALRYGERARALWVAACEGAEPRWCTYAASLTGRGGEHGDLARAYDRRACDQGFAAGCVLVQGARLGLGTGQLGDVQRELSRLCDDGEPTACTGLASLERRTSRDAGAERRAAELAVRACELGNRDACLEAGIQSELGEWLPRDEAAMRRRLGSACERGLAEACLYLAQDAAARDAPEPEIERLDRRGCELGNAEACRDALGLAAARHDDAAARRFATEACRMGAAAGCQALIERDAELPVVPEYRQLRDYRSVCDVAHPAACERLARLEAAGAAFAREVLDAIHGQDAAAFARLWSGTVEVTGVWFADRACARRFPQDFTLTADRQPEFLRCLATLDAHVEPPGPSHETPVLAYDPGLAIHLGVRGRVVEQIWADVARIEDPDAASIDPDLLASHLVSGTLDVRPGAAARTTAGAPAGAMSVAVQMCVDRSGWVDGTRIERSTPLTAAYARAVLAATATWRFTPFLARGKPVRVCAIKTFSDSPEPQAGHREQPANLAPMAEPGGPPPDVPPTALAAFRITGQLNIVPDDATKTALARAALATAQRVRVVGSFKLCISSSGRIQTITTLKSTGVPVYDSKLLHDMREGLRYRPFLLAGVPSPVCTVVTFIYSQN
jgi:TPR repeat protein